MFASTKKGTSKKPEKLQLTANHAWQNIHLTDFNNARHVVDKGNHLDKNIRIHTAKAGGTDTNNNNNNNKIYLNCNIN